MDVFEIFESNSLGLAKPLVPIKCLARAKPPLPPDLLLRILKYLPITSLPSFARACRRFKVLVYDDELWEQHLKTLGIWEKNSVDGKKELSSTLSTPLVKNSRPNEDPPVDHFSLSPALSAADSMPSTPTSSAIITGNNYSGNLLDFSLPEGKSSNFFGILPGFHDPFVQKSPKSSNGVARAAFKEVFSELLPYYRDFRYRPKDSRVFKDFSDPLDQAKMLVKLIRFGKLNITYDSVVINNVLKTTIEYCENMALHHFELAYNAINEPEMKKWATLLLTINGGVTCIQVFIQKNSIFFDHLYDPLDNFAQLSASGESNYAPMKEFFKSVEEELVKQAALIDQVFPPVVNIFYMFVERVVEDVITEYISILIEEAHNRERLLYFKTTVAAHQCCQHVAQVLWKEAKPGLEKIRAEDLMYQLFEPMMEQYLTEEMDEIRIRSEEEILKWSQKLVHEKAEAQQAILNNENREVYKRNYLSSFRKILKLPTTRSRNSHSSPHVSTPNHVKRSSTGSIQSSLNSPLSPVSTTELQAALLWNARLEKLQQTLSLEMALQMVHLNKDALRRVGCFFGYPDRMGLKIQDTLEFIFITLLQTLGPMHIKPGFDTAVQHLGEYKPDLESTSQGLAPLVEFFELVHIADLMQQMMQVYYDEEMCQFIDKRDFLNSCNEEKKKFEKILDESVASGLNKGIQVLIDQVEFILTTEQKPEDFKPENNVDLDLQPTKACTDAVDCLSRHAKLVVGCSDKNTLDVFFQEIGLRFFGILTKHLKKFVVNMNGGFQVISDLNCYCSFMASLRQPEIKPYFIAMKELGNIYIISNAHDIGVFVREADRFNGVLRAEDVYEFCQKREDWLLIKKEVEKQLFGLRVEDCSIM